MNIIGFDTSTEACSAALLREDGELFSEFEIAPRQHTKLLPQMMDAVLAASGLKKNELTHCTFANGPGAFTGIRIAASMAQGIGIALDIPLVTISTLKVLAQACIDKHQVLNCLVALDARMGEVYWAVYDQNEAGLVTLNGKENLNSLDTVMVDCRPECGAGHGWLVGREIWQEKFFDLSNQIDAGLLPNSEALVKLAQDAIVSGNTVSADNASINYLRNQVAEKSRKQPVGEGFRR